MESGTLVPGSVVRLAAGTYQSPGNGVVDGITGTPAAPYVVRPDNGDEGAVIIQCGSGDDNCIHLINCDYLEFHDITFDGTKVGGGYASWNFTIGRRYNADPDVGSCTNITVRNCEIDLANANTLKINEDSTDIQILGCEISRSGQTSGESLIYIGEGAFAGSATADGSHDILIQDCRIHDNNANGGKGVNIKTDTYNVTVRNCLIYNIDVSSQGAVVVLINTNSNTAIDHNVLIDGCWIWDISKTASGSDGDGINIGKGTTTIRNCVIWECLRDGINVYYDNFKGDTYPDVFLYNNTVWGCGGEDLDILQDAGPYDQSQGDATVTQTNNITEDATGDYQALAADFVGPVTGTANAGNGEGSGFVLASGSAAIDTATTIPSVVEDITKVARPQDSGTAAHDFGAYEDIGTAPSGLSRAAIGSVSLVGVGAGSASGGTNPVFVGSDSNVATSSSTIACTFPTVENGDIAVFIVSSVGSARGAATVTAPSGSWTQIVDHLQGGSTYRPRQTWFWYECDGTEDGTGTGNFTRSSTAYDLTGFLIVVRNVDTVTPVDSYTTTPDYGYETTSDVPAFTTSTADTFIISVCNEDGNVAITSPGGVYVEAENNSSGNYRGGALNYRSGPTSAGSVATHAYTVSTSQNLTSSAVALDKS
jgi:hypothetical protein